MMRLGNRIAVVLGYTISVAAIPAKVMGQNAAVDRPSLWGTIALGQAGITDSGMIHSSVGLSLQRRHLIVTGRVSENQQGQKGAYRTRVKDVGILAGYATTPNAALHFSAAGGLAIVRDINDSTAVGFPIEADATWRFLPWVGLGLRVFGVGNKLAQYGGISLALQVGRLR